MSTDVENNANIYEWGKFMFNGWLKLYSLNLKSVHFKVLGYLLANTEHRNRINIDTQADVADFLELNLSYVNQCFKSLEKCNVIIKIKKNYYLNTKIINVNNTTNPSLDKPLLPLPKVKTKATAKELDLEAVPTALTIN